MFYDYGKRTRKCLFLYCFCALAYEYDESLIGFLWCLRTEEAGSFASLKGKFRVEGKANIKENGKIKLHLTLIVD